MATSEKPRHAQPPRTQLSSNAVAELRALCDAAVDGIIVASERGVILDFNLAAERLFGYAANDVIGQPLTMLMPEPDRSAHDDYIHRYLTTGEARIIGIGREVRALRADGSTIPIALSVGEIPGGDARRFIGLIRDLSAQRAAEEEAHLLQNRLTRVGRVSLMGEMAAGLAHELNQPLSAIVNYAQAGRRLTARPQPDLDAVASCLEKVTDQAIRAGHIIDKLRDFLRKDDTTRATFDTNEIVSSTLNLIEADGHAEGIPIETDLADGLPQVNGDLIQLQQVLLNLTRNAVDAMHDGVDKSRGIVVRSRANAEQIEISVVDHGPGVPPDLEESIFLPFVTTKRDGLGVGLAISRTIVTSHDGELFCHRNPVGGAVFGFRLPAVTRELDDG